MSFEQRETWPLSPPLAARWTEQRRVTLGNGFTVVTEGKGKLKKTVRIPGRAYLDNEEIEAASAKKGKIVNKITAERVAGTSTPESKAGKLAEFVFAEVVDENGLSPMAPRAFGAERVKVFLPLLADDYRGTDAILLFQHDETDETEGVEDRAYPISVDVTVSSLKMNQKLDSVNRTLNRNGAQLVHWYDTTTSKEDEIYSWPKEGKIWATPVVIVLPPELVLEAAGEEAKTPESAGYAMKELAGLIRHEMRDQLEWAAAILLKIKYGGDRKQLLLSLQGLARRDADQSRGKAAENIFHALKATYAALREHPEMNESDYRKRYREYIPSVIREFAGMS